MNHQTIHIYTDGSYNNGSETGAYAAIIFIYDEKIIIKNIVNNSTHNRMELCAVIESIDFIIKKQLNFERINIYTDSQYVVGLTTRKEKLHNKDFLTNKGTLIRNADLVKKLIHYIETLPLSLIKVKAHLKETNIINYNREVDKIARAMVRDASNI